jgi:carboxymethylenebutenolidase
MTMAVTRTLDLKTADGTCDCTVAHPDGGGPFPAILMFMDGIGIRPALIALAERFASEGYFVLLPNMFYRNGRAPVFDHTTILAPENRPRLMEIVQSVTPEKVVGDAGAFLNFIAAQKDAQPGPAGVIGYCMGGGMMMRTAAHYPERVTAGASFHGGRLATDNPDSPHLLAPAIKAELYFGHADQDAGMPPEQMERLAEALRAGHVRFRAELYAGALHGFTQSDLPMFNAAACAQHLERALDLFGRTLRH